LLTVKNIGTLAAPLNAGTVNACGSIFASGAAGTTYEVRRCYVENLRLGVVTLATAAPVVNIFDVWGDGSSTQTISTANVISRGGKWTNSRAGTQGNNGSHWDDAYTSTTTGRITIMANEPTSTSAAQCSATLGLGSGFNGSGSMVISKLTDVVNWTTPVKIYGHNFLAGGCALSGTDCQNLIFEYKIDTGSGFGGSWTFLANTVRRSAGGVAGTNTVTLTTADRTALTRQPQIGDFVQSGSFRLPANTTVTLVVGDVVTCSNNFVTNLTAGEFVTFSPVNVAVSAANGYSLQVRTYPTAAAATTLLTSFSMGIQTDATAYQTQHPLPGSLVNITNLVPQTRVKVNRVDTGALLQQASCGAGTTLNFDFQYTGLVKIEARNASGNPAYKPWITQATISPTAATNVVALQESDK
jgi:predicted RecA/RadA family phage recombinase